MSATAPILEFREATLVSARLHQAEMHAVNFALAAGEVLLVRVEEGHESLPLGDAACGLLAPTAGEVRFEGRPWIDRGPWDQARARGRIRRVFDHAGWVSNLEVKENVVLAELHHTRRHRAAIDAEAGRLAVRFGLPGLPDARPSNLRPGVLRRCEWVRAFLGHPALILLERPEWGVAPGEAACLWPAVEAAAGDGAAIVWLTGQPRVWEHRPKVALRHAAMHASRLATIEEDASPS